MCWCINRCQLFNQHLAGRLWLPQARQRKAMSFEAIKLKFWLEIDVLLISSFSAVRSDWEQQFYSWSCCTNWWFKQMLPIRKFSSCVWAAVWTLAATVRNTVTGMPYLPRWTERNFYRFVSCKFVLQSCCIWGHKCVFVGSARVAIIVCFVAQQNI